MQNSQTSFIYIIIFVSDSSIASTYDFVFYTKLTNSYYFLCIFCFVSRGFFQRFSDCLEALLKKFCSVYMLERGNNWKIQHKNSWRGKTRISCKRNKEKQFYSILEFYIANIAVSLSLCTRVPNTKKRMPFVAYFYFYYYYCNGMNIFGSFNAIFFFDGTGYV